jgi:adenine deaminase
MSSVRSLSFSKLGFLAICEDADFVHLYDLKNDKMQTIDFFGEIAGHSFDKGGEVLFISCADDTYGGLIEYHHASEFK